MNMSELPSTCPASLLTNDEIRNQSIVVLASNQTDSAWTLADQFRQSRHYEPSLVRNLKVMPLQEASLLKDIGLKDQSRRDLVKVVAIVPMKNEKLYLETDINQYKQFDGIIPLDESLLSTKLNDMGHSFFRATNQMLSVGSLKVYFEQQAKLRGPHFNLQDNAKADLFFDFAIKQKELFSDAFISDAMSLNIQFNQEAIYWLTKIGTESQLKDVLTQAKSDCGAIELITAGLMGTAARIQSGELDLSHVDNLLALHSKVQSVLKSPTASKSITKTSFLNLWMEDLDGIIPTLVQQRHQQAPDVSSLSIH